MVNQIHRLDFSQIDSPRIRRFRDYWNGKRASPDVIPLRADFDPARVRELLPDIVVIEVEQDPSRFRYRLVGTRVVEFNNLDFTGLYLGTIGWQEERQLVDACTDVVVGKKPYAASIPGRSRMAASASASSRYSHSAMTASPSRRSWASKTTISHATIAARDHAGRNNRTDALLRGMPK